MYFNPYDRKFILFAHLPPEVQNIIWQVAVNGVKPRIVEVKDYIEPTTRRSEYRRRRQFISTCPIPGVLHACRTSRSLALGRWKLSFAARYQEVKIFFDFSCDTLFLPPKFQYMVEFVESISSADREALKSIAFDLRSDSDYYDTRWDLGVSLRRHFPALTQLTFTEKNIDNQRRTKRLRAERRLFNAPRRIRPRPKRDPRKTIIQWYRYDIPLRRAERLVDGTMRMLRRSYLATGFICPKMERVDYIKRDLAMLEFDEDQARLDWYEGRRKFKKRLGKV